MPLDTVRSLGQYNERWRFKDPSGANPRQQILHEQSALVDGSVGDELLVVGDVVGDTQYIQKFVNVPFVVDREWRTIAKYCWRKGGTLPVFEGRSVLFAAKHILRSRSSFGCRHLILSDSLTAACAISRGRASTFHLRQACTQIGALSLASGTYFNNRWIPSEWNPADNPSRGIWTPSKPKRFLGHGDLPGQHPTTAATVEWVSEDNHQGAQELEKGSRDHKARGMQTNTARGNETGKHCNQSECQKEDEGSQSHGRATRSSRRHDVTAVGVSVQRVPISLQALLELGETEVADLQGKTEGHNYSGHYPEPRAGQPLPRWRGCERGRVFDSSCCVFQHLFEVACNAKAASGEAILEGLEKDGPPAFPIASSLGSDLASHSEANRQRTDGPGASHGADVRIVFEAKRRPEAERQGCGPTCPEGPGKLQALDSCLASGGGRSSFKDWSSTNHCS